MLITLDVPTLAVRRELAEMRETVFAATNKRSVLGTMNDFTNARWWRCRNEPEADPLTVSLWLAERPMQPFRGKAPDRLDAGVTGITVVRGAKLVSSNPKPCVSQDLRAGPDRRQLKPHVSWLRRIDLLIAAFA